MSAGATLTVSQAARAAGVTSARIRARIRGGGLSSRQVVLRGHVVTVVPLEELEREFGPEANHRLRAEQAEQRASALEAELDRARRERDLAVGAERATNRYCDRLEDRLTIREREIRTVALQLGRVEGERNRYQAQLSAPRRGFWQRLLGR